MVRCWKWGGWAGPATMTSRARRDVWQGYISEKCNRYEGGADMGGR